jgi:hypothetical protein
MRGKDKQKRETTGYIIRGLQKQMEKQAQELKEIKWGKKPEPIKPRSEMNIQELLEDNERIINNNGKETKEDSEVRPD